MNHLSFKSLVFYGMAIGSVSLLFKVVTACGETNLKAPPAIAGNYRFEPKSLPEWLKSDVSVGENKRIICVYLLLLSIPDRT
ncbi:MAG: hypothetical protein HC786_17625 [Richelia sp. CSU_2_1]|nr:hypothetical protein [Microcoleus sp. SU_5_6]NJL67013.1 hypothetical protein [Microcoleus sp. SM1_3_4]NJR23838.1 hypothetical protein [Richelia sp. CSU_2_1]